MDEVIKVYNFEVEDWHTYFVSKQNVLVHNDCSATIKWTNHGFKHFPQKNLSWSAIVKSTKNGPAKYIKGINIESFERTAWQQGTKVTNGKTWRVMKFDKIIGASGGVETQYMRVEMSAGTIHGHPITRAEYLSLIK